ncbi:MAG: NAD(P)H-hydrate dehydratase [Candidatus Thermoplasmatota archaeon]
MAPRVPAAITPEEVLRLDANAEELGVPVARLMANAGRALADAIGRRVKRGDDILLFCGHGNNGGDGIVAAVELLARGHCPWIVLAQPRSKMRGPGRAWLDKFPKELTTVWSGRAEPDWLNVPLVVDCLLGSGLSGAPRAPYAAMIRWMNRSARSVLSCDVPSGLGSGLAVKSDATVAFHAPKVGMTQANSGRITVAPIGIPAGAADIGVGDLRIGYNSPDARSHKGENGLVVVAGGSIPYVGAPLYAALGALRSGADLVHILTNDDVAGHLRSLSPEPIVHGDGVASAKALKLAHRILERGAALLVGPGLGHGRVAREDAQTLLDLAARSKSCVVVDADGLDALDRKLMRRLAGRLVVTPHAREFRDLFALPATARNVERMAREHGITILCKGAVDVVSDGANTRRCLRGHPTMTVGGTGDVLAGAVATLLAKGAKPFDAACAATYLCGAAGELAAAKRSWGASALDVAESIPSVLLRL